MFLTYLRRELINRRRQTLIVAAGLAIGIALVATVSAVSAGVKDSQDQVLDSLYGVGTDITVTQSAAPGQGGNRFAFGSGDGQQAGGIRSISRVNLRTERGAQTFAESIVTTVRATDGVEAVATALKLTNTTFVGEMPDFAQNRQNRQQGQQGLQGQVGGDAVAPPTGGADGAGGTAFSVDTFSVLGIDASAAESGPMSSVTLATGRLLTADDIATFNAVLDESYAVTEKLVVGAKIKINDKDFTIVGTIASASSAAETASDAYIPVDIARTLSGVTDGVTNIYIKVKSNAAVAAVVGGLEKDLPEATVSSTADLASGISGSLSSASDLLSTFGKWLSIIVLIVAFMLAILFTISGVTRRTREFGTLKALGWKNRTIVRQVAAESTIQGLLGGVLGAVIAYGSVAVVNAVAPTLKATSGQTGGFGGGGNPGGGLGGNPGGLRNAMRGFGSSTFDVVLKASVTPTILLSAIGLAVLGGLLAGAIGGLRASRLSPAESLRSVA